MSGTSAECANHADTAWYPLRDGVLQVVQTLAADIRFGFSAFTGESSDPLCPVLSTSLPMLDNYVAIANDYNMLLPPVKGQTPTRKALDMVGDLLKTTPASGEKFILLVTDGMPDYCADGNALCPPDSVVGGLQTLVTAGIKTFVFGIASPLSTISVPVLQAFANAGAGQPVLPPLSPGLDVGAYHDQCGGVAGWTADLATAGKLFVPGVTIGTYSTTGGTASVYQPDPANQTALVNQLATVLSGVKSCVFDLKDTRGNPIRADLTQPDRAHVLIGGAEIPHDASNGWRMNTATQLELIGSACATWRMPSSTTIDFQFPCDIVMP
jgi:hypothetical protein